MVLRALLGDAEVTRLSSTTVSSIRRVGTASR